MSAKVKLAALACAALFLLGCEDRRARGEKDPVTYTQVAPILERACVSCHAREAPAAGYVLVDLMGALGCTDDGGTPLSADEDGKRAFVEVLSRSDHRDLISDNERARLVRWAETGVRGPRPRVHPAGISDPRSESFHGALAAKDDYHALRDDGAAQACGRCHQGAPASPKSASARTDGATSCTTCHTERGGVLACSTCHGDDGRSYPPRDTCFFGGSGHDPHAAHVADPGVRVEPFGCNTCHPVPDDRVFTGTHADGQVDVRIDAMWQGDLAGYDADTEACSVACHTLGGERAEPTWKVEKALDCASCHLSPPDAHPPGACNTCHPNMGETASSLRVSSLHMNGSVDVGDGKGTCGSCHGRDASGAPADGPHAQHLDTLLTTAPSCDTCHPVPSLGDLHAPATHMNGRVDVTLGGRAQDRAHDPSFDSATGRCNDVACHGAPRAELRWGAPSQSSASCEACHATPPPPPHSTLPSCGGGLCHHSEVTSDGPWLRITESGRALHIDGTVQAGADP